MTSPPDVEPQPSPPINHRPPSPRRSLGPLTFLQPDPEPLIPHPSPEPTPAPAEDAGPSPSGDPWTDQPDLSSDADRTSSPGSSADVSPAEARRLLKLGEASAQATARTGVLIAGGMAHRIAAKTEDQQAVGLYLTDEEDAANIGNPVGSIVARRGGVAGKALSPDAADAVAAAMGLANYVSKQIALVMQLAQQNRPQPGPVDV